MKKIYTCERWPFLRLGGIQFREGKYATDDEDVQHMIEHSDGYGVHILAEDQEADVSPPPDAEEEAPRRGPGRPPSSGARQGTTGTGNLRSQGE